MIKINTTTNVSAQVFIGENENQKIVAYLNGSVTKDGEVSINKSIQNSMLFKENKESVLSDFSEFETYVYGLIDSEKAE